ncbi:MAG: hypothetical protein PHW26_07525, partial [Eubacteriales bacterium]|nr:hypothetical protein [Eubacteriales bacterium]
IPVLKEFIIDVYGAETAENWDYVQELLTPALNYYTDFILPQRDFPVLNQEENRLLDLFLDLIGRETEAEALQTGTYAIARENGIPPKDFFQLLYQVLLGKPSGPRIGGFVAQMGAKRISDIIKQHRK